MITSHSDRHTRQNYGYFSRLWQGGLAMRGGLFQVISTRQLRHSPAGEALPTSDCEWRVFAETGLRAVFYTGSKAVKPPEIVRRAGENQLGHS